MTDHKNEIVPDKISLEPPFYNPLGLRVGDRIVTSHFVDFSYEPMESGNWRKAQKRVMVLRPCVRLEVFIVGSDKRAEGIKYPGGYGYSPEDYEPTTFSAKKYHWLYQCRFDIKSRMILVHPDHIKKVTV